MKKQDSYRLVECKADEVLKGMDITSLAVDPFAIAKEHRIEVKAKPSSAVGVSGMLVRHGDEFGIMYATHIESEGFQRFSVAHELGHYFLDGHIDHVIPPGKTIHESRSGFVSKDKYEIEADFFAASLLMPRNLFTKAMEKFGDGLGGIEKLSGLCKTSLTATAIRFSQLSDNPVAVAMTSGQAIEFCSFSKALFDLDRDLEPFQKGMSIPSGTETRKFNSNTSNVLLNTRSEARVGLQDWFGGQCKLDVLEEIIGLGNYGKTLTIISVLDSLEEEEEDEDLEESWTPRFRR